MHRQLEAWRTCAFSDNSVEVTRKPVQSPEEATESILQWITMDQRKVSLGTSHYGLAFADNPKQQWEDAEGRDIMIQVNARLETIKSNFMEKAAALHDCDLLSRYAREKFFPVDSIDKALAIANALEVGSLFQYYMDMPPYVKALAEKRSRRVVSALAEKRSRRVVSGISG